MFMFVVYLELVNIEGRLLRVVPLCPQYTDQVVLRDLEVELLDYPYELG